MKPSERIAQIISEKMARFIADAKTEHVPAGFCRVMEHEAVVQFLDERYAETIASADAAIEYGITGRKAT